MFLIASGALAITEPNLFIEAISKGFVLAVVAIPAAHWHYGDEFNYKFKDL